MKRAPPVDRETENPYHLTLKERDSQPGIDHQSAMPVAGYITLTLEAFPEGKAFVSRCRELGVASCGDTAGEAIEAVKDATLLYLNTIEQLGERDRIFAEQGIKVRKTKPREVELGTSILPPNGLAGSMVVHLPLAA